MTNEQSLDTAIPALLTGIAATARSERHASAGYQAMESSETIGQLVRRLEHATTGPVLDAYDVLTCKFGMAGGHDLLDALTEVPHRYRMYRRAYEAETHVGCVDRAVTRLTRELSVAGGLDEPEATGPADPRTTKVALAKGPGGPIGEQAAANALVLATHADDAKRIQRLSCDAREITRRLAEQAPELPVDKLHGMVRLVLGTAADIVHEQDGLD